MVDEVRKEGRSLKSVYFPEERGFDRGCGRSWKLSGNGTKASAGREFYG